ncbi:hypothetical protein GGS20DRAFT_531423 [Poronia punctata]|nr:hypothetical protein GGS20DRAFT_531423 [Poronia punctata]
MIITTHHIHKNPNLTHIHFFQQTKNQKPKTPTPKEKKEKMYTTTLALMATAFAATGVLAAEDVAHIQIDIIVPDGFNELFFLDAPLGQYYMDKAFDNVSTFELEGPEGVSCTPYVEDDNGGYEAEPFTVGKPTVLSTVDSVKVRSVWCI